MKSYIVHIEHPWSIYSTSYTYYDLIVDLAKQIYSNVGDTKKAIQRILTEVDIQTAYHVSVLREKGGKGIPKRRYSYFNTYYIKCDVVEELQKEAIKCQE